MATDPRQRLTIQEYLAFERKSEAKHDYYDGEIFAMSGASRIHNLIALNISGEIRNQLKGRPCEVYSEAMRVRTPDDLFTYPDVVALCGEPQFVDTEFDTLLNPMLIVEVLSPTTEGYDRGLKSSRYRSIPTLVIRSGGAGPLPRRASRPPDGRRPLASGGDLRSRRNSGATLRRLPPPLGGDLRPGLPVLISGHRRCATLPRRAPPPRRPPPQLAVNPHRLPFPLGV